MKNYFNDSPIGKIEDDEYGFAPFAEALAKSLLKIRQPIGTTIALNGPWGSGKSSVVNLIRSFLDNAKDDRLIITEFKCWWYRGEEALALAFLQNLNAVLRTTLKDRVKDLVPKMGRGLLQAGPILGSAIALTPAGPFAGLVGGAVDFVKRYFPDGDTLEATFQALAEVLEKENRRFLVIIDDIDRLEAEEALAIFRLIKSVGRLPNVMYLVVFDRQIAEKAIKDRYPSEGPHFLEKIIQAAFELPSPLPTDLNNAVLASIAETCGSPSDEQVVRFMNVFYDVVAPYITSPRHVSRFRNSISVTWPAIAHDVNLADYVALETLRLYEPSLFNAIKSNKDRVCGIRQEGDGDRRNDGRFSVFLKGVPTERHDLAKTTLQRLFPRLEEMGYGSDWIAVWKSERRICDEAYFDTYFRLSLSDDVLSTKVIDELIEKADDKEFIQATFRQAAIAQRRTGASMVPVYLDELNTHAKRISKAKVEPLLTALFEIHDEIDLERDADSGFMAIANTSLRYHWLIRRLTRDRFSIEERTATYLKSVESAALGWRVDFVASARDDYQPRENRPSPPEEDCLTTEGAVAKLTEDALQAIRAAASNGSLLHHTDLLYILFRWFDFSDRKPEEIRALTGTWLKDPIAVAVLARAMTRRTWSMGIGGFGSLGDRVAKAKITAQIRDDMEILDLSAFRSALEAMLANPETPEGYRADVQTFLEAWDRQRRGDE